MRISNNLANTIYTRAVKVLGNDNVGVEYGRNSIPTAAICNDILHINYKNIYRLKPTINDIIRFAEEYGCSVDYLLGLSDNPYPIG